MPQSVIYSASIAGQDYRFDPTDPIDLSIGLDFHGEQPNSFGLPRAEARTFSAGGFVGDTRQGGSCNCETVTLNPHGSGTHTECAGHVTIERRSVTSALREVLLPAVLLTVTPRLAVTGELTAEQRALADDRVVSRSSLESALMHVGSAEPEMFKAVIVRTLPNDDSKRTAVYTGTNPPYFTVAGMHMLRELGVDHLVVDLPSVDREDDGGLLAAHRTFFGVDESRAINDRVAARRTITELAYIPSEIRDGAWLLSLQIPPFALDAAPSRPLLMRIQKV
jgi:kynurenine formamidase